MNQKNHLAIYSFWRIFFPRQFWNFGIKTIAIFSNLLFSYKISQTNPEISQTLNSMALLFVRTSKVKEQSFELIPQLFMKQSSIVHLSSLSINSIHLGSAYWKETCFLKISCFKIQINSKLMKSLISKENIKICNMVFSMFYITLTLLAL
jgi:hypothetical protein